MGKDPAFLFYYQDFLVGCEFLTAEETGLYIRIICHLADKWSLSEKHMLSICKGYVFTDNLKEKFSLDQNGNYYQKRLREEVEKRRLYSESRRNNAKAYAKHMENENENEKRKKKTKLTDEEFLESLKANEVYKYININIELGKMDAWLLVHPGRQKTRRFIVNWLNKIEKPFGSKKIETPTRTNSNFEIDPPKDPISKERLKQLVSTVTKK